MALGFFLSYLVESHLAVNLLLLCTPGNKMRISSNQNLTLYSREQLMFLKKLKLSGVTERTALTLLYCVGEKFVDKTGLEKPNYITGAPSLKLGNIQGQTYCQSSQCLTTCSKTDKSFCPCRIKYAQWSRLT